MPSRVVVLAFAALVSPVAAQRTATANDGMVAAAHPAAVDAGVAILTAGGTAFDAAVAIASTLNVVEPNMSGIGGYGTILVYDATTDRVHFLNASGRIPRGVVAAEFRAPTPGWLENRRGARAVSTPGNVNAWEALWRRWGVRPWPSLFERAVRLAEGGFPVSPGLASAIASAWEAFPVESRAFYGRRGEPLAAGDTLVQRALGHTFRRIAAAGAAVVYGGVVGEAIDSVMRASDGFLRLTDLREHRAEWWDPIHIDYRGQRVYTAPPPANAFDALVRLRIMGQFNGPALGHNSVAYLHRFAEATRHAFSVRLQFAGDPDVAPPPLDLLLSDDYAKQQAARIDPERAASFETSGHDVGGHTTHFVVADRWGNIVSATQTLGNSFGARIMVPGTGIWLNNSLAYSTFDPPGNPMDAHPGRRKLSGDVPVIIFRNGRPWAALGTPGGHTIGQTVPQIVMNLIDFEMGIGDAIAAPRVAFVEPDALAVESTLPDSVRSGLEALGHHIRVVPAIGNAHGLMIRRSALGRLEQFIGAADPRGEGTARGTGG